MRFYFTAFSFVLSLCALTLSAQDKVEELTNYINGSQLVTYSESSYLSDNTASAITYIDFCPNGRYHYSYDGSYNVKGAQNTSNRNNRASGGAVANNQGEWKVVTNQGLYYLEVTDYTAQKSYYPINLQYMISGKWKVGNVTYVFAPGKGNCRHEN